MSPELLDYYQAYVSEVPVGGLAQFHLERLKNGGDVDGHQTGEVALLADDDFDPPVLRLGPPIRGGYEGIVLAVRGHVDHIFS